MDGHLKPNLIGSNLKIKLQKQEITIERFFILLVISSEVHRHENSRVLVPAIAHSTLNFFGTFSTCVTD